MRRKCDNKEGDLNRAHPCPRVLGIKRGSDIAMGDITKVGMYSAPSLRYVGPSIG